MEVNVAIKTDKGDVTSRNDNGRYTVVGNRAPLTSFVEGEDVLIDHGYVFRVVKNGGHSPPVAACIISGERGFFGFGLYRMAEHDTGEKVEVIGPWDSPPIQLRFGLFDEFYELLGERNGYHAPNETEKRVPRYKDLRQLRLNFPSTP